MGHGGTEGIARSSLRDPDPRSGGRARRRRAAGEPIRRRERQRWRQLTQTTGLTPDQIAQVCPRDGETRCSGTVGNRDLSGWVWATGAQVHALMGLYEPAILTADPPAVSGPEYLGSAMEFLEDMAPTHSATGYNFHHSFTGGWTSSTEEDGRPTFASAGFGWYPISGSFGVGPVINPDPVGFYGIWMWRPASDDITPPTITPTVSGTLGKFGWYVSDVTVAWDVRDAESAVSTAGCETTTVSSDSAGTTFTCEATSAGGTATRSVVVKRDTTAPVVTCMTPPQVFELYQLGAWVRATVTDATSGPGTPLLQGATSTATPGTFTSMVTGFDQAGNRTTRTCAYQVVIPPCNGLAPTIVANALNNVINGTAGRDVIQALGGADTVNGLGGDDVICGHDGPDTIYGGDGNDWIDGGASTDDLNGGNGDDFLDGGLHNDSLRGDDGKDTCRSGEVRMSSCEP
jgi:RTX calcium-binding nonapeptide repeat (4 copies)